jgi:hypothetical protein
MRRMRSKQQIYILRNDKWEITTETEKKINMLLYKSHLYANKFETDKMKNSFEKGIYSNWFY